jgi:hypothetical protein
MAVSTGLLAGYCWLAAANGLAVLGGGTRRLAVGLGILDRAGLGPRAAAAVVPGAPILGARLDGTGSAWEDRGRRHDAGPGR